MPHLAGNELLMLTMLTAVLSHLFERIPRITTHHHASRHSLSKLFWVSTCHSLAETHGRCQALILGVDDFYRLSKPTLLISGAGLHLPAAKGNLPGNPREWSPFSGLQASLARGESQIPQKSIVSNLEERQFTHHYSEAQELTIINQQWSALLRSKIAFL